MPRSTSAVTFVVLVTNAVTVTDPPAAVLVGETFAAVVKTGAGTAVGKGVGATVAVGAAVGVGATVADGATLGVGTFVGCVVAVALGAGVDGADVAVGLGAGTRTA